MKNRIEIQRLNQVLRYNPDTGVFVWKINPANGGHPTKGKIAGTRMKTGYWAIEIAGRKYSRHVLAWAYYYGRWPREVDHRRGLSDRISNLREATRSQNNYNARRSKRNTPGAKGVSWQPDRGKWIAYITCNKQRINIGRFNRKVDAIRARDALASKLHKEFKRR
jgi:hypothetical protein